MYYSKVLGAGVALSIIALLISPSAFSNGRGVLVCSNCTTVGDFSNRAESYILASRQLAHLEGVNRYRFVVYNSGARLLAQIVVARFYTRETGQGTIHVRALTGTVADMDQVYHVAFPNLDITWIPANVAGAYIGSGQQAAISAYLGDYYADSDPVQDDTTLVVFQDYSSAVYQLTDASASSWTMVHDSGHDSNGNPLNDAADPVAMTPPPGQSLRRPLQRCKCINTVEDLACRYLVFRNGSTVLSTV
jgi:hypothetical protein